jgi:sugar lactone lactonase YvrE
MGGRGNAGGYGMTRFELIGLALSLALAATPAAAGETTIVRGVAGPEGPLVVDGALYFVGWNDNALWKLDGRRKTAIHRDTKCGHNGLALTQAKTFLLACTDDPGAILELSLDGKVLRRWDTTDRGARFVGGINDVAVAPNGAAYATVFGPYDGVGPPGELLGKVLYLAPGGTAWREVAGELNYANGVGVSPDGTTLYVSQTVSGSILKFRIEPDGTLSHRSNFALLDRLTPPRGRSPWLGPDSLKIAQNGDLYVAQFFGGKILKLSPQGKLKHVFHIAAGDGTTNVAFDAGEKHLYVSVVKTAADPKAVGSIVRVENVR